MIFPHGLRKQLTEKMTVNLSQKSSCKLRSASKSGCKRLCPRMWCTVAQDVKFRNKFSLPVSKKEPRIAITTFGHTSILESNCKGFVPVAATTSMPTISRHHGQISDTSPLKVLFQLLLRLVLNSLL